MVLREATEGGKTALTPARAEGGFWTGELGYRQSVLVTLTALLLGLFFHWKVGYRFMLTPQALALFAGGATVVTVGAGRWLREDRIVRWLFGIPFAVTTVTAVTLLAMVGGVLPQETLQAKLGVPSAFGSWPFLFVCLLMQLNLIGSAARRAVPLNRANIQYVLTHAGLAIALFGGAYGSVALERYNLVLFEGVPTDYAYDARENMVKMPFTATLKEFEMETFEPTLAVARMNPKAEGGVDVAPGSDFVKKGMTEKIGHYRVEVLEYLPKAAYSGDKWVEYPSKTSSPAALIVVRDTNGKELTKGWVSSGGLESDRANVNIDEKTAVVMPDQRPKAFRSQVLIDDQKVTIEVNKPFSMGQRSLYQLSYDEKMGAASHFSVIEVVRDPSLPVVYAGMLMLLAGVAMILWRAPFPANGGVRK